MFKQSEIGAKCTCGVPETVCRELGARRFLVPTGYYGGLYQRSAYYLACWWTLECDQCKNRRQDFFVYKWHRDGSGSLVDGSFIREDRPRRYPDIYKAILNMMEA